MCQKSNEAVKQDLMIISEGGKVQKRIDENIIFKPSRQHISSLRGTKQSIPTHSQNLGVDNNTIWNFFLMSVYLWYDNYITDEEADTNADLSIPNQEI